MSSRRSPVLLWLSLLCVAIPFAHSFTNVISLKAPAQCRPFSGICLPRMSSSTSEIRVPGLPQPAEGNGDADDIAKPGISESNLFTCSPGVSKWREKQIATSDEALRILQETAASALAQAKTNMARWYWAYHLSRFTFFTINGALGYLLAQQQRDASSSRSSVGFLNGPIQKPVQFLSFRLNEAMETFEQDVENVEAGRYKLPWDMDMGLSHRQASPQYALDSSARVVREAAAILQRRWAGSEAGRSVWMFPGAERGSELYPEYYKNNFHFQTDGWMSSESAKAVRSPHACRPGPLTAQGVWQVYEASTETIFSGRQDAMQRSALVPLGQWLRAHGGRSDGSGVSLLEVACGTGRFNTFIRDNFPNLDVTMTDLSPFYLEQARDNGVYWETARRAGQAHGRATYVQAAAEDLRMFEDASFDAVVSVYLFHEMPHQARAAAAREWARVLKPGGIVVFTDSLQLGDRPAMDDGLGEFEDFNEPHYASYIAEDIPSLFMAAGLTCDRKDMISTTKTLSFLKPSSSS